MCTNGVNTGQFEQMLQQVDDHIALERRWSHNLGHMASDGGFIQTGDKLHEVMSLLDEARAAIADARDLLEKEAESASGVTVNLV